MRSNIWFLCLGWFVLTTSWAQQPQTNSSYSFTLDEAIEFALENNYQSINARQDVAKALKRKWEATADGLPQINGNIDYQNQLKQPVTLIPGEVAGGQPGTFVPVVFGTKQQASASATLTQLIFDGSYLVGLQAAKSFLQFNNDSEEKTQLEVRKGVINAYGSVLVANESTKILENNVATLEKNYNEIKAVFENGLAEEENVEQLQITLLQIKNQLTDSKRIQTLALQMFNLALGVDVNTTTTLSDDLDTLTTKNMDTSATTKPFIIENNIDYRLAYLRTQQRQLEFKLEKSRALPKLSAFLNYGTAAFDNEFVFLDSDTRWFQSSILGANLSIPIFSSFRRGARSKQAKIALQQSNTQFIEAQQQIQLQYNNAKGEFEFAIENFKALTKNLDLAKRIEKKNQIKFKEGLASGFDLRQAQLQLYSSQQQALQAMLDIINKKATLETIINTPKNK